MPCEGFEGDSAWQDRIDFSFSAVCAKLSCLKVVQFSATMACRFKLLRVRVRDRWRVLGAGPRRASFLLSLSLVLSSTPLQFLLTIAHQLLSSGSPCNIALQPRSFRGVCFSVRHPPPQAARCRPAEAAAAGVSRLASPVFVDGRSVVHLLPTPHSLIS